MPPIQKVIWNRHIADVAPLRNRDQSCGMNVWIQNAQLIETKFHFAINRLTNNSYRRMKKKMMGMNVTSHSCIVCHKSDKRKAGT